ncbi:MAG: hypothetical protein EOP01_06790, partial [Propionibacteriaceae bacterium]
MSLPDLTDVAPGCCYGTAVYGPERCTCWQEVLDVPEQAPLQRELPTPTRSRLCGDCAFRPDSPERTGVEHAGHDVEDLDDVVAGGAFFCHDGMARVEHLVH